VVRGSQLAKRVAMVVIHPGGFAKCIPRPIIRIDIASRGTPLVPQVSFGCMTKVAVLGEAVIERTEIVDVDNDQTGRPCRLPKIIARRGSHSYGSGQTCSRDSCVVLAKSSLGQLISIVARSQSAQQPRQIL